MDVNRTAKTVENAQENRLTLEPISQGLWVSGEVVRKRIRREAHPCLRGHDNRTYYYVDPDSRNEKYQGSEDQDPDRSWVEYLAAGSGLVAIAGVMTYGLGLLALWMPIWVEYTHNAAVAWHAVSLVPTTTVAGLGVGKLIASPSFQILCYYAGIIGVLVSNEYAGERWGRRGSLVVSELAIVGGFAIPLMLYGRALGWGLSIIIMILIAWVIAVQLFLFVLAPLIIRRRKRSQESDNQASEKGGAKTTLGSKGQDKAGKASNTRPWWFWPLVAILLNFVITAVLVILAEPALPRVDITGREKKGALLTHSDGYWYVFDLEGDDRGELFAIPDSKVDTARVFKAKQ